MANQFIAAIRTPKSMCELVSTMFHNLLTSSGENKIPSGLDSIFPLLPLTAFFIDIIGGLST